MADSKTSPRPIAAAALAAILTLPQIPHAANAASCNDAVTTVDMINCAAADLGAADTRFNAAYTKTRAGLDDTGQTLLRDAQRAWIAYRDAECLRQRDFARGGTMAPLLEIGCKTAMTEARTRELETDAEGLMTSDPNNDGVFWRAGSGIDATFDCENMLEARVGLVPRFDAASAKPTLTARIAIGTNSLEFPVGGNRQDAFCAADISLTITDSGTACPGIRADDGMCDAFHINWDATKQAFVWSRN